MGKLTKEEYDEFLLEKEMYDTETFENFCNACDNYGTEECPFNGKVFIDTKWKNIGCANFID